jgi:hypothetical protein
MQPFPAFLPCDGDSWFLFAQVCLEWDPPDLSLPSSLGWPAHSTTPTCWLRWGFLSFLPVLASNCNSPHLSIPSS